MTLVSADRHRFPLDPWALVETSHIPDTEGTLETLFSLGNGHLGIRGAHMAEADSALAGTFLNGFHETFDIRHAESAYGFAKQGQRILYVPDAHETVVRVDGEQLTLATSKVIDFERRLDFATGVYECTVLWQCNSGARVTTRERRILGAESRSSLGIELEISADRRIVADVASVVSTARTSRATTTRTMTPAAPDATQATSWNRPSPKAPMGPSVRHGPP
jgi:alpha,alpha-trehalose phosphorylase